MREKTRKYEQLQILKARHRLSNEGEKDLLKYERGYLGEVVFDESIGDYVKRMEFIHIKDYTFKYEKRNDGRDGGEIQLDNLIIAGDALLTFEVKNYQFDLEVVDGNWRFDDDRSFPDPTVQTNNQKNKLRMLVDQLGSNMLIHTHIVFINPGQTIYDLPNDPEIIVHSNLMKRLDQLLRENRYDHGRLVAKLEDRKILHSMYDKDYQFEMDWLRPGVYCP